MEQLLALNTLQIYQVWIKRLLANTLPSPIFERWNEFLLDHVVGRPSEEAIFVWIFFILFKSEHLTFAINAVRVHFVRMISSKYFVFSHKLLVLCCDVQLLSQYVDLAVEPLYFYHGELLFLL